ncbi:unnamed protein product [Phaedon cochleariae]|uniref:Potassium channel domain-containing protein n=1 Tax=Phaedon cochleariae TaxID=80249 RepID=A0A9P0DHU6_PHACE|nr:unnamed protein product [Phaedon cochleariae]
MLHDHDPNGDTYSTYRNTYLRRSPPPGHPSECCYDHEKHKPPAGKISLFCCCYTCPGTRTTSILATLGVCFLVLAYTILGAFLFMALEGSLYEDTAVAASKLNPNGEKLSIGELRERTVNELWGITENLNILYRENWTRLAAKEVLEFEKALIKVLRFSDDEAVRSSMGTMGHPQNVHKWSFSSSFLYSLTLITTIGYGSVSPRTAWGKLAAVLYALVGVPLMLLYLSAAGDALARGFRRLYGRLRGAPASRKPCRCADAVRVPVVLCLAIVLAYICSGAVLFHRLENWSLLEGSYFCFTSLGTIGFGDLLPGQNAEEISLCACSAYILTGMALVAMCFSLVQDEVLSVLRYLGGSCSKREKKKSDEEAVSLGS